MVNGVLAADLVLYAVLFPLSVYNFITHRWTGVLAWYYLSFFCGLRVVSGALGVSSDDSLVANILIGVGTSPLILAVDGLIHEARAYRNPNQKKWLGWGVIYIVTGVVAVGVALSVTGALQIYRGHPKSNSYTHWEAGTALMVVVWVLEVLWASFSLLSSQALREAPRYRDGTILLYSSMIALIFLGIRVIYALIAVCTQRRDLSPVYGTTAVRVVLMFLPEAFSVLVIIFAGFMTGRRSGKA
ncbi:hypothetical protein BDW59DRAFT_161908 [Aspergillus cavernicola]|uniref:DUF7702 domain-containing protein n=1 Tax=Aspergillus cavernicola TaxID=176166 RepID=A0ABR4IEB0_9EURO